MQKSDTANRPPAREERNTVSKCIGFALYRAQRNQIELEIRMILNTTNCTRFIRALIADELRPLLWYGSFRRFYNPAQMLDRACHTILTQGPYYHGEFILMRIRHILSQLQDNYLDDLTNMNYATTGN